MIDIFCGAGGFSEGFRQAGFEVIWAVDKWQPAIETHQANHPDAIALLGDVETIAFLPDNDFHKVVPDSEIIIGSPPCVAFSNSNKSGKGVKEEGVRLIEAFLRIVARKRNKPDSILKYWILENVPNSRHFIKDKYSASELGLESRSSLTVKNGSSRTYNALFFDVPSKRLRYFCGEFPEPEKILTDLSEAKALTQIMKALGSPNELIDKKITDPNYEFSLPGQLVSDHHYIQKLARYQSKKARRLKQDKGYMGKMNFPEDTNKPSRTIMANMSLSARESMIFGNGRGSYRAPTIREVASLMSFPIDYSFHGKSIGIKHRLIGNAVPPKMAFALAKAIGKKENMKLRNMYPPINHSVNGNFVNLNREKILISKEKPKSPLSRFKYHIPYLIVDSYRVELTNHKSNFKNSRIKWIAEIHHSQGKRAKVYSPKVTDSWLPISLDGIAKSFISTQSKKILSHSKLQNYYCLTAIQRRKSDVLGPEELLNNLRNFIDVNAYSENIEKTTEVSEHLKALPMVIAIGYYILVKILNEMGE